MMGSMGTLGKMRLMRMQRSHKHSIRLRDTLRYTRRYNRSLMGKQSISMRSKLHIHLSLLPTPMLQFSLSTRSSTMRPPIPTAAINHRHLTRRTRRNRHILANRLLLDKVNMPCLHMVSRSLRILRRSLLLYSNRALSVSRPPSTEFACPVLFHRSTVTRLRQLKMRLLPGNMQTQCSTRLRLM